MRARARARCGSDYLPLRITQETMYTNYANSFLVPRGLSYRNPFEKREKGKRRKVRVTRDKTRWIKSDRFFGTRAGYALDKLLSRRSKCAIPAQTPFHERHPAAEYSYGCITIASLTRQNQRIDYASIEFHFVVASVNGIEFF